MMEHMNLFMNCIPKMVCQIIIAVVLVMAGAKLLGVSRNETRNVVKKYGLVVLITAIVLYLINPNGMVNVGTNFIVLLMLSLATKLMYENVKAFQKRFIGAMNWKPELSWFWKKLLENPIRLIALGVILITFCQNWWEMIILVILLLVLTNLMSKRGLLSKIDWKSVKVQKIATGLMILIALSGMVNFLGIIQMINHILEGMCIVVGIIAVLYLIANSRSRK